MGRFILKYSLIFFLFLLSSCNKKSQICDIFCEGDEWYVEEFTADPYPAIVPFEKNHLMSALEDELYFWKVLNNDSVILSNDNNEVAFKYSISGDTLVLLSNENESPIKLVIKEESEGTLHLNLIGLFRASLNLKRKN